MTFEQKIKELLVSNGMFDNMADEVMERIKTDKTLESMIQRWNDTIDEYPPQVIPALWMVVRLHALEYIDENLPMAWFRPMFAE